MFFLPTMVIGEMIRSLWNGFDDTSARKGWVLCFLISQTLFLIKCRAALIHEINLAEMIDFSFLMPNQTMLLPEANSIPYTQVVGSWSFNVGKEIRSSTISAYFLGQGKTYAMAHTDPSYLKMSRSEGLEITPELLRYYPRHLVSLTLGLVEFSLVVVICSCVWAILSFNG